MAEDRPFYAPAPTHNARRFHLPVAHELIVGPPERTFMMGGVGLGSAIVALEEATGRPLVWATAQYLSFAQRGSVVDIDVHVPVVGRTVTQARASSHVGEREIITVNAALGERPGQPDEQYVAMPDVPGPEAFDREVSLHGDPGDLHSRIERRRVVGGAVDHEGHAYMWIRATRGDAMTAGLLAIFADFMAAAIPLTTGSTSLDNTLRIRRIEPAEWCLLDARIQGVANGFFHGEMCLFAQDGTLLATASQSGILPRHA